MEGEDREGSAFFIEYSPGQPVFGHYANNLKLCDNLAGQHKAIELDDMFGDPARTIHQDTAPGDRAREASRRGALVNDAG